MIVVVVVPLLFAAAITGPPTTRVGSVMTTTTLCGIPDAGADLDRGVMSDHRRFHGPPRPAKTASAPAARRTIHLISLPSTDDEFKSPCERLVRECWRWKDATDGTRFVVEECAALSNCARLDVVLVLRSSDDDDDDEEEEEEREEDTAAAGEEGVVVGTEYPSSSRNQHRSTIAASPTMGDVAARCAHTTSNGSPPRKTKTAMIVVVVVPLLFAAAITGPPTTRVGSVMTTTTLCGIPDAGADLDRGVMSDHRRFHGPPRPAKTASAPAARRTIHLISLPSTDDEFKSPCERLVRECWRWKDATSDDDDDDEEEEEEREEDTAAAGEEGVVVGTEYPSSSRNQHRSTIAASPTMGDVAARCAVAYNLQRQLKRTVEVVSVQKATEGGGRRGRIKTILDGALNAGKSVRDERVVPEIRKLREFGPDGTPPSELARIVAEAARERAVEVSVAACVARLAAMETDTVERISRLRQRVDDIVTSLGHAGGGDDASLRKAANKLLHGPTVQLREGTLTGDDEIEDVFRTIEKELLSLSCNI
ncbi:LOW QUALITY PROTEIN: hypothetical protein ACHAXA_000600 [Cyclostephanos tholiformis]|uniref:Uncharacterized protein n=1 Tax=Cyclostephanos tholiformis TaxID=382380 RepID=A0ABD3SQ97_9STRA